MTCTDHDRAHCPSPSCHVLAVCWASVPGFAGRSYPYTWRRWAWLRDHGYSPDRDPASSEMAARLVSWMRWDGAQPCAACEGTGVHAYHGLGSCENCGGSGRVLDQHPLDAVMSHADRVVALASKCPHPYCDGTWHDEPLIGIASECHHDGINWATVAMLLDQMETRGIALDVVHEWRPPIADAKAQEPDSLWTDQHFQAMSTRYPFSWTDIREAAAVWREWLDVEIPRDMLETFCVLAARSNMLPVTYADAAARLERVGRESRL